MSDIYDLLIAGSGPAGLAAAIYASRAALSFAVIEKAPYSGGQLRTTDEIDNYPGSLHLSGPELSDSMRKHAGELGACFISGEIDHAAVIDLSGSEVDVRGGSYESEDFTGARVKVLLKDGRELLTNTLIIASGAKMKKLNIPGEEEFAGMGVSYCATCDGAFFKNSEVAVIGGGDTAVEDALLLSRLCSRVYLIHRRDTLRAAGSLASKVLEVPNIEFIRASIPESISGDDDGVKSLLIRSLTDSSTRTLSVSGVFAAIGTVPNSEPFVKLGISDEKGYIRASETGETFLPQVFAAGDVRTKRLRQVVTAAADGANAVYSAVQYLENI